MRHLILVAALFALACTPSRPMEKVPQPPAITAVDDGAPRAPLQVRWNVLSDAGGRLKVEAVIERRSALRSPVTVMVEVPAGLQLVSGQTTLEVPADAPAGASSLALEFSYTSTPLADLVLVADLAGARMGVHAVASYRFGRPEPTQARPAPTGPSLQVGGRDLGPSIPLGK
jgi:hypothetical protein